MVRRSSLGSQFNTVIGKRIRQMSYVKTFDILSGLCDDLVKSFVANKQFYSVTGNTVTSFSVGLYYKGKRVHASYAADFMENPTRKTLKKGEAYDLPIYYDGGNVTDPSGTKGPFVGSFGHGGQWGPTLGKSRISRAHSRVRDTWNIIAVCPVEYAVYNNKIFETMYNTYEEMPDLFTSQIIYARVQNFKT